MAKITSDRAKEVLKNMADFGHAIYYAADMLEAVEKAEQDAKIQEKIKAALIDGINQLSGKKVEYEKLEADYRAKFNDAVKLMDAKRSEAEAGIASLRGQVADLETLLRQAVQKKADEEAAWDKRIESKKVELKQLQESFDEWKKTHGMAA